MAGSSAFILSGRFSRTSAIPASISMRTRSCPASVVPSATDPLPQGLACDTDSRAVPDREAPGPAVAGASRVQVNNASEWACAGGPKHLSTPLPNFARACGRVPVGGHPDKRPDSRQGFGIDAGRVGAPRRRSRWGPASAGIDRTRQQPAAGGKTGEPRSPRGTQLEATTNGLFWSRPPSKGGHRRGLFLIAGRADGVSPIQTKAASSGRGSASIPCLQRTVAARAEPRRRRAGDRLNFNPRTGGWSRPAST